MKRSIFLLLLLVFTGCTAVVREDGNVKGIGIGQEKAQEVVSVLDSTEKKPW